MSPEHSAELKKEIEAIAAPSLSRPWPATFPARLMVAWLRLGVWLGPRLAVRREEREGWNGWKRERYVIWRSSITGKLWRAGVRVLARIFPDH